MLAAANNAGLWTLVAPREVGGRELSLPALLAVVEQVGTADPTVAWQVVNSASTGMVAAWLPEAERQAVFGERAPFGFGGSATGARATPVEGGFRLEGSWPFMTGAADARWSTVVAMVLDADGEPPARPDIRRFVVPMADLQIHDTWGAASSMRGTGSQAVSASRVFVPAARTVHPKDPLLIDRPLYRVPSPVVFYSTAAAVVVGALRGATRATIALCGEKISRFDGHAHFEEPRVQQAVSDASGGAACLSAGLGALAERMWAGYVNGAGPDNALRAEWWSTLFFTFDLTCQLASRLYTINTSSVYATANPVERAFRDIHAIGHVRDLPVAPPGFWSGAARPRGQAPTFLSDWPLTALKSLRQSPPSCASRNVPFPGWLSAFPQARRRRRRGRVRQRHEICVLRA